ncbi:hypothetical protein CDAR_195591 [Caerostris darwini]|uniref:Uncharacterized protein n=1 Tax=Caerostris darwini TaxID=1538125 RepID=A0AAV4NDL5_9ARAC|nr:hypothetical protein CDAR_195591 [Caerostris darwini]
MKEPTLWKSMGLNQPTGVSTDTQHRVQPYYCNHQQLHHQQPEVLERQQKVEMPCHRGSYLYTWNRLKVSNASALQPAMTSCRNTSTVFDLASDGICPLCRSANMDDDHLRNCSEFIDVTLLPDDITARYWEARRRMAEQSQTGVG